MKLKLYYISHDLLHELCWIYGHQNLCLYGLVLMKMKAAQ